MSLSSSSPDKNVRVNGESARAERTPPGQTSTASRARSRRSARPTPAGRVMRNAQPVAGSQRERETAARARMVGTASADYALRLGEPGEHDDPLVDERDALETRVDRCNAALGKLVGCEHPMPLELVPSGDCRHSCGVLLIVTLLAASASPERSVTSALDLARILSPPSCDFVAGIQVLAGLAYRPHDGGRLWATPVCRLPS